MPNKDEKDRLEQRLMDEVQAARAEYEQAKRRAATYLEWSQDVGLNHPDGTAAVRKASKIQRVATARYAKALKALTHFALSKPPGFGK